MAGFIPDHKIEEVRAAADIVQVISHYVPLTAAGRVHKGLCPFHGEKTPSFLVNPERRIFHCFGCGVGGNVFRFLMMHKGLSFPEAVAELAERYGIDLPRVDSGVARKERGLKETLYKTVDLARKFFQEELWAPSGREARNYLAQRGIGPGIVKEYSLGWAPAGWDNLRLFLSSQKIPGEIMEQAGLVKPRSDGRSSYDVFRARVVTPIFDPDGRPVAFGGRLLAEDERQPKYLNSPETPIFNKGRMLYGLDRHRPAIKERQTALIVEGYFDLLSLVQHGVRHVVATLGTALSLAHLRLLKGMIQQAVLIFDADEAGRNAASRALPLFLSVDLDGRVLGLPEGHDPDTFVRQFGPAALEEAMTKAVSLIDFYLTRTVSRHPSTLAGKSRVVQEVTALISQVEGRARQDLLRQALAERLGLSEQALLLSEKRQSFNTDRSDTESVEAVTTHFEYKALQLALRHHRAAARLLPARLEDKFTDQAARQLYEVMARQYHLNGSVDPGGLGDLDPELADLVTGLALDEDGLDDQDLDQAIDDYLRLFGKSEFRAKAAALSRRIKQAQADGDQSTWERLIKEKNRLLREKPLTA